ncbi:MAG: (Fe-S)-binding protein [Fidelibacterota bacterium]
MEIDQGLIRKTGVYSCIECGKCTAICPVSKFNSSYSPRKFVTETLLGYYELSKGDGKLWECLTCQLCNLRCPSDVKYIDFIKQLRTYSHLNGAGAVCAHGGAFQSIMRFHSLQEVKQNRLKWITKREKVVINRGEYLYFVGCLPYYDAYFSSIGVRTLDSARGVVKILNKLGIVPALLENERCCGHDLLWAGDPDSFEKLAELNIKLIKESGAKYVITSCGECFRTLKMDYADFPGGSGFKVLHISQFLNERISSGELKLKSLKKSITYQDSCRLGRHMGVIEEPRNVMNSIPGISYKEMDKWGKDSICCGTSLWMNCDYCSKRIQIDRLRSAREIGADYLITTCPKCYIHFRCTMSERYTEDVDIEVKDFSTLIASVC